MRKAAARPLAAGMVAVAGCGGAKAAPPDAPPPVLRVSVPSALQRSQATAFAMGGRRAVTVAHVLRDSHPVLVAGRRARVVRVDRRLDVAVLRLRGTHGAASREASARAGQRVTVRVLRRGRPRSLPATVEQAITAHVRMASGRVRVRPALALAASVQPGDSGAPVLDGDGRVVGMVFAQASQQGGLAYAVDARVLGRILR